ncbi:peptidylprolyl isomerase [Sphingomonas sp.]|uniref:peptidylprolyl isomerase n=1 Tax=Sphingomonas sp. TaxID=28214 RepID=UPI001D82130A|nr:peptidylprolyl isomerase [Sphingomonas sp.]MBX9796130.1 SurA N-terminal domain-containing protein [Sphingomonas sp.]
MLSLFRRIIYSRLGVIVALAALMVIAVAFVLGDVTGVQSAAGTADTTVATVGGKSISAAEFRQRFKNDLDGFRRQQPGLTAQLYAEAGGFDGTLSRMIAGLAMEEFAKQNGMAVPKSMVDQQIAAIPNFQGLDGKFDQKTYETLLRQIGQTDRGLRADIARSVLNEQLTTPILAARQFPQQLAQPYASLLLEKRSGTIALIPAQAVASTAAPTEAEITTFYKRNQGRYRLPERRVIRYAIVAPQTLGAAATTPTEAEIAAAYRAQAARFAASEKRDVQQVVVPDRAKADALAAQVRAGAALAVAAKAIGLEAASIPGIDRGSYAGRTSADLAAAVFAAPRGGVAGPVKSPLGWTVARVDKIEKVAAKTLDQARAELTTELTTRKTAEAMTAAQDRIGDAIDSKATFDELVQGQKLQAATTPPVTAEGRDPANPALNPNPLIQPILKAAFATDPDEGVQIAPMGERDGTFAIVSVARIVPPATPPLAELREVLVRDFIVDRARQAARQVAAKVVSAVNSGTPLSEALKATGLKLPPTEAVNASRAQLEASQGRPAPALVLLFSMANNTAKLIEAPQNGGWFVLHLTRIDRGDASATPAIVAARRAELGGVIGPELAEQFVKAVRRQLNVKVNEAEVARLRAELVGGTTAP